MRDEGYHQPQDPWETEEEVAEGTGPEAGSPIDTPGLPVYSVNRALPLSPRGTSQEPGVPNGGRAPQDRCCLHAVCSDVSLL